MVAPTRPDDEVVGAFVPITLAGKEYKLRELPRRANREWQSHLTTEVRKSLEAVGPLDSADEVIEAIADSAELMMDLILSYDAAGAAAWDKPTVLPDRDTIDATATDRECYEAIKKVTEVAFPFGADLLRLIPELRPFIVQAISRGVAAAAVAMTSAQSMSSARRSTGGTRSTSKPA